MEEKIGYAKDNGKSENCDPVSEAIKNIDEYLEGHVSEKDAQDSIEYLAGIGAFYNDSYVTSVKSYKSDDGNKNYNRFDTEIIGWVAYYNYKKPDYSINPE